MIITTTILHSYYHNWFIILTQKKDSKYWTKKHYGICFKLSFNNNDKADYSIVYRLLSRWINTNNYLLSNKKI